MRRERGIWRIWMLSTNQRRRLSSPSLLVPTLQVTISFVATKDGRYSVKSGYWLGRLRVNGHVLNVHNQLWSKLWTIQGPPKIRHVLRCACKGSLPVNVVRFRRRWIHMSCSLRLYRISWCVANLSILFHYQRCSSGFICGFLWLALRTHDKEWNISYLCCLMGLLDGA